MAAPGPEPLLALALALALAQARFGLRWWFLQAGAVAGDSTLGRFGEVVPQMPPVGVLDSQRRALGSDENSQVA